jgi:UDP-glucuronate 4-epimerase
MTNKKILITGAAGFIGFHAAQRLASRGDKIIGVDNFNDYYSPTLKRTRQNFLQKKDIKIIEGDVCDLKLLTTLIK